MPTTPTGRSPAPTPTPTPARTTPTPTTAPPTSSPEKVGATTTYYGYGEAGQLCWQGTTTGTQLGLNCPTTPTGDTTINRDAAGNGLGTPTTPLTYNAYNQVASIDGRTQAYYDLGNDLRVATNTTTGNRIGLVNSSLGVVARTTPTGTTYYVRAPSGKILAKYGSAGTYYYATDSQASITTLISPTAGRAGYYHYSPYGGPTIVNSDTNNAAETNPWRYIVSDPFPKNIYAAV